MIALVASAFCGSLLSGCAGAKPPTFDVVDVGVTERGPDGVVVTFVLVGTNTNPDPLPLDEVTYSLNLNGRDVFRGTRMAEATLPANGTQRVMLPVPVPVAPGVEAPTGQAAYRLQGSMVYKIPGSIAEIFFDSGVRRPSIGFGEGGTLDFASAGLGTP